MTKDDLKKSIDDICREWKVISNTIHVVDEDKCVWFAVTENHNLIFIVDHCITSYLSIQIDNIEGWITDEYE